MKSLENEFDANQIFSKFEAIFTFSELIKLSWILIWNFTRFKFDIPN